LKYALAVREHDSMSAAAAACHVSQPSLSQGIKKLEETLGVVLFERGPRGAVPTDTGRVVLQKAARVVRSFQEVEETAEAAAGRFLDGRLRLGVIQTIGPYLLPDVMPAIEGKWSSLELEIDEGLTDRLLESLCDHELDAVLIALPWEVPEEVELFDCFEEPFYVALPKDDHLVERETVSLDEIDPDDLLLLREGHCLRDHTLEACDIPPEGTRRAFQGASLETIRAFVANGWGVGLFPALAVDERGDVVFRPPAEPAHRIVSLAVRRSFPYADEAAEMAAEIGRIVQGILAQRG
jgi:LysR family hydrogen peroxide-inducible transcriptional activator